MVSSACVPTKIWNVYVRTKLWNVKSERRNSQEMTKFPFNLSQRLSGDTIENFETEEFLIDIRHIGSFPRSRGKRFIALIDNTTTLGAVTKGRSSYWVLYKLCQKMDSVSLRTNLSVLDHGVPSELSHPGTLLDTIMSFTERIIDDVNSISLLLRASLQPTTVTEYTLCTR